MVPEISVQSDPVATTTATVNSDPVLVVKTDEAPGYVLQPSAENNPKVVAKLVAEISATPTQSAITEPSPLKQITDQPINDQQVTGQPVAPATITTPTTVITDTSATPIKANNVVLSGKENAIVETLVSEKTSVPLKDLVLASNKTAETTYSAPEKLVRETANKQPVLSKDSTAAAVIKTPLDMATKSPNQTTVETAPEATGESKESVIPAIDVEINQPEISNSTIAKDGVQATSNSGSTPVLNEQSAPLENFTVPVEIGSSTNTSTVTQTNASTQSTISASIRQQVVEHLSSRLEGTVGNEKVTLFLNPEKLGQIEVQITAKNDALAVVLTVPEGQVEKAVQDSVKDLTESLLARGGRFQQVDVKIEAKSSQNEREQQRDQANKEKEAKDQQGNSGEQKNQQNHEQYAWEQAGQEG